LDELIEQPAGRRGMMVHHQRRFRNWVLADLLIERSRERCFQDPAESEELARLGLAVTDVLDEGEHGAERIEDLRARAWGRIGNSFRVRADLMEATTAFETAFAHLKRGTGESLERADLLDLKASLLRDQRRFDDAMRLLRRALHIFLAAEEKRRAAKTLVKMSTLHEHTGPEQAIPILTRALELIDPEGDPRLYLNAQHNLITNLAEAGRFMEAQRIMIRARPLYPRFADRWMLHRRTWLEGKIARGLGQLNEAEAHLLAAREGFFTVEAPYEGAVAALDLASLYAEQGRMAELKRLAEETLLIFSSLRIDREALAALTLWYQASLPRRWPPT
jgi:tetratricopeptide (TPR) repeat protein